MDLLAIPGEIGQFVIGIVLPFFFVLMLVVFVHELGHYLVGRWCGIRALAFSVGFGRELIGYTDRNGTRWKLCAIPLGGYVRYLGDLNVASQPAGREALAQMTPAERAESFPAAPLWKRAAAVAAGPAFNFIFAIVVFATIFTIYGRPRLDPVIAEISAGSAAEEAGFAVGDRLVGADGRALDSFTDLQRYVQPRADEAIAFEVERDGRIVQVIATPRRTEREDQFGNKTSVGLLGVAPTRDREAVTVERFGPIEAVGVAVQETGEVIARTAGYLGKVVTGREPADQIGGPIRVAKISGDMATLGFGAVVNLVAVLSISIGLLNLLPIPILDGGHLLFYAFEALLGRPLSPATQEMGFRVGLFLILSLMVFATWNDLTTLIG